MASQAGIRALFKDVSEQSSDYRRMPLVRVSWWAGAALVGLLAAVWFLTRAGSTAPRYVTAAVTRGSIVRSVSATGTVNPVVTVQVGSYVSGPIIAIYADFNAAVKKDQLIAKIDPRPFEVRVAQARAQLANARAALSKDQADLRYKKLLYERNRALLALGAASRDTVDNYYSGYRQSLAQIELDRALVAQQEAALQEVVVSLNYTNIYSPVDGTVVARNVDVGQTVAASFQTPTLFLIARDLTRMQVDCSVSESDIGGVREGQTATFKVDAFPDRELMGTVAQVRQAPVTVQNVVTYDVVLKVPNPQLLLKPGMTANVTIITAQRSNVLRVPIQAIRFVPHKAARTRARGPQPAGEEAHRVWVRRGSGLRPVAVATGLSDGNFIEIASGKLRPGDAVVVDEASRRKHVNATANLRLPN